MKKYVKPIIEIIFLNETNIITCSPVDPHWEEIDVDEDEIEWD